MFADTWTTSKCFVRARNVTAPPLPPTHSKSSVRWPDSSAARRSFAAVPGRRTPDASSGNRERIFATETQIALQLQAEVFGALGPKLASAFTSTDTSRNWHLHFYKTFSLKKLISWPVWFGKLVILEFWPTYIARLINKSNSWLSFSLCRWYR
jgi:hypothetical protein